MCTRPNGILSSPEYKALLSGKRRGGGSPRATTGGRSWMYGREDSSPFIFCVNFALPPAPALGEHHYVNIATYFGRTGPSEDSVFEDLWERFRKMSPKERDARFKLIPVIVAGPTAFQKSVANRPAIMGNKIRSTWFESENHMEVVLDVGSSFIASQMWRLMLPQAAILAMDMAWVIQGNGESELPEVVLASVHMSKPDMHRYRMLPRDEQEVEAPANGTPKRSRRQGANRRREDD